MKVHFSHGRRNLGVYDLDAVPRTGDAVVFGPEDENPMRVRVAAWQVEPPAAVWVELQTEREFKREMRGPHYPEREAGG